MQYILWAMYKCNYAKAFVQVTPGVSPSTSNLHYDFPHELKYERPNFNICPHLLCKLSPDLTMLIFAGFELETMVCGSPDIPLHLLKSVATYKGG